MALFLLFLFWATTGGGGGDGTTSGVIRVIAGGWNALGVAMPLVLGVILQEHSLLDIVVWLVVLRHVVRVVVSR